MPVEKVCMVCLAAVFFLFLFKQIKSEYTILIMIVASALIFYFCIDKISYVIHLVEELSKKSGVNQTYILLMFKIIGISFMCQITSDICKDNGMQTLSSQVETFGKLGILVSGIPLISSLMDMIVGLL